MAFKSKVFSNINVEATPSTVTPTVSNGSTLTVIGFSLANKISTHVEVSAKLIKVDSSEAFLIKSAIVMPGGALVVVGGDQKLVLEAGDSIIAYANQSNSVDSIISYLV